MLEIVPARVSGLRGSVPPADPRAPEPQENVRLEVEAGAFLRQGDPT